jgi:hypothetical protein
MDIGEVRGGGKWKVKYHDFFQFTHVNIQSQKVTESNCYLKFNILKISLPKI